jgi:hypothetical protein
MRPLPLARPALAAAAAAVLAAAASAPPGAVAQYPAGSTHAVLSMVDSAGGHADVVRHWTGPGTGEDVEVYPFTPYFWDGCLPFQDGALMFLVTSPAGYQPPGMVGSGEYARRFVQALGGQLSQGLSAASASMAQSPDAQSALARLAQALETPGDPAYESLKAVSGLVNSLPAYEDYGYAVFMFIRWKWIVAGFPFPVPVPAPCAQIDFRSVPEGYGIPFVASAPGAAPPAAAAPAPPAARGPSFRAPAALPAYPRGRDARILVHGSLPAHGRGDARGR